jgi:hypothetical protein
LEEREGKEVISAEWTPEEASEETRQTFTFSPISQFGGETERKRVGGVMSAL